MGIEHYKPVDKNLSEKVSPLSKKQIEATSENVDGYEVAHRKLIHESGKGGARGVGTMRGCLVFKVGHTYQKKYSSCFGNGNDLGSSLGVGLAMVLHQNGPKEISSSK